MKKILDILKYKLSWQTYKDAFFWTFVSIWLFVDVVTFSCIYYDPDIDWEWTMHLVNWGFILFFAVTLEILSISCCAVRIILLVS